MAGEIDKELGRRLRALRQTLGLSQTSVADHLGITFQQVQKYENGTNRISVASLVSLCRLLTINPGEFLEGLTDETSSRYIPANGSPLANAIEAIGNARVRRTIERLVVAISKNEVDERQGEASAG